MYLKLDISFSLHRYPGLFRTGFIVQSTLVLQVCFDNCSTIWSVAGVMREGYFHRKPTNSEIANIEFEDPVDKSKFKSLIKTR